MFPRCVISSTAKNLMHVQIQNQDSLDSTLVQQQLRGDS